MKVKHNKISKEDAQKYGSLFLEFCLATGRLTEDDIGSPYVYLKTVREIKRHGTESEFKTWLENKNKLEN